MLWFKLWTCQINILPHCVVQNSFSFHLSLVCFLKMPKHVMGPLDNKSSKHPWQVDRKEKETGLLSHTLLMSRWRQTRLPEID